MINPESKFLFASYGYELAFLLQQGGYWLENLYHSENKVSFSEWSYKLNQHRETKLENKQRVWLWETIITEPKIKENFEKERLISYTQELKNNGTIIQVLPANQRIAIFIKNYLDQSSTAKEHCIPKPDGKVLLKNKL